MSPLRTLALAALLAFAGEATAAGRADAAAARVAPQLKQDLAAAGLAWGAPVFLRLFKLEAQLELWVEHADGWRQFRSWPICAFSGALGPKQKVGDRQAPEGFYGVTRARLNPWSSYHLSFDLGYPNAYDRAHGRTGSLLMVHGDCVSIGCYAMGDAAIEEIYTLVDAALSNGQREVPVHAFPFRFDRADVDQRLADPQWGPFWTELRAGWVAFESTRRPPHVQVRDKRYRVTAASP